MIAKIAKIAQRTQSKPPLGEFLYYQGKYDEAGKALSRAVELGRGSGDEAPPIMAAFLYASRGQRDKIDPIVFQHKPEQYVDGDGAYWIGGIYAMLGDCAAIPNTRRSWKTFAITSINIVRLSLPTSSRPSSHFLQQK